ncbi:MAG: glycosyltransferase family 2 protein [Bacteroidales bacterium]|nr:glycosyltransferase family 2 protein [Bacteroidales bacterium]
MRFSVIMPVCLEPYPNCASNRESKFIRSVNSFIRQIFTDAELIIISDGSKRVREIYESTFVGFPNIKFIYLDKQILFSGKVRQAGLEIAKGEIICYLDADDVFGPNHLAIINADFRTDLYDWIYFDDVIMTNTENNIYQYRGTTPAPGQIGSSSIAHKRIINVVWIDGYGHDWALIEKYLIGRPSIKITTPEYCVCHVIGFIDV